MSATTGGAAGPWRGTASLDGMGLYFVNALLSNDPYPVMAWLMIVAIMIIVFNLVADIVYGLLDPRVRYD